MAKLFLHKPVNGNDFMARIHNIAIVAWVRNRSMQTDTFLTLNDLPREEESNRQISHQTPPKTRGRQISHYNPPTTTLT